MSGLERKSRKQALANLMEQREVLQDAFAGSAVQHERLAGELDGGLAAEEFEEDGDAGAARHGAGDNGPQIVKGAAGDDDRVAGLECFLQDVDMVGADGGAQFLNDGVWDLWPMGAKMHDAANAAGVVDFAEACGEIETGEEIVREEGFSEPDGPLAGGTLKADAREVDFDVRLLLEMGGGNVLVLGLGSEAEPGGGGGGCRVLGVE